MLSREKKILLGDLLAAGHRRWGIVAPRRDYREDDEGGAGTSENVFLSHPFLQEQPVGAASDLTAVVTDNSESLDAAEERENEASPELQPSLQQVLAQKKSLTKAPAPTLTAR